MSVARRAILKMIGGSAAAVPALAVSAQSAIAQAAALGVAAAPATVGPPQEMQSPTAALLGKPFYRYLNQLKRQHEGEMYARAQMRINGIDPDIAALKSLSPMAKARMQARRNSEEIATDLKLQNILWPPD